MATLCISFHPHLFLICPSPLPLSLSLFPLILKFSNAESAAWERTLPLPLGSTHKLPLPGEYVCVFVSKYIYIHILQVCFTTFQPVRVSDFLLMYQRVREDERGTIIDSMYSHPAPVKVVLAAVLACNASNSTLHHTESCDLSKYILH